MNVGAYVVVDAKRVAPNVAIPADYPALLGIGGILVDDRSQKGTWIKSVVDGPIEDIYTCHFVATGTVNYDGTVDFSPEAVRVLNLIKIGADAENVMRDQKLALLREVKGRLTATDVSRLADLERDVVRGAR